MHTFARYPPYTIMSYEKCSFPAQQLVDAVKLRSTIHGVRTRPEA